MNASTALLPRLAAVGVALSAIGCTCSETPTIEGRVVDLWGGPVEGVKIAVDGVEGTWTTDRNGTFELVMMPEAKLTLTGDGWIRRQVTVTPADTATSFQTDVEIIPEPETPGFHAVGPESLIPLGPVPVARVGTDLKVWHGLRSSGEVTLPAGDLRVLFHTPLKLDEIARLGIELHRLTFIEQTDVDAVEGSADVDLNLWVSGGRAEVEREALTPRNYLFKADDVAAGTWAFSTLQLLDPQNSAAYDRTPPAIRTAHPFTVE